MHAFSFILHLYTHYKFVPDRRVYLCGCGSFHLNVCFQIIMQTGRKNVNRQLHCTSLDSSSLKQGISSCKRYKSPLIISYPQLFSKQYNTFKSPINVHIWASRIFKFVIAFNSTIKK